VPHDVKDPIQKLCHTLNKDAISTWNAEEFEKEVDLLKRCLDFDCDTRITAEEALEHPFFQHM
jgi:serine/threonine protein kinase